MGRNSIEAIVAKLPDLLDFALIVCAREKGPDGLVRTKSLPVIHWVSPSFTRLTGFALEDCRCNFLDYVIQPSELALDFERVRASLLEFHACKARVKVETKNGNGFHAWFRAVPAEEVEGGPYLVVALDTVSSLLLSDSTAQDAGLGAVGQSVFGGTGKLNVFENERFLRAAIEASGIGLWEWHVPSNHVHYSAEWFTMLGYDPYEYPPGFDTWKLLAHEEDAQTILEKADRAFNGEVDDYDGRFRMRCKDGSWKWIKATGEVLERDAENKAILIMGTHIDLSREVEREEELKAVLKRAEAAREAKSSFLAVMSHEIRTPLNGVIGMLDQLRNTALSESDREKLSIARRSARDLLMILNDTLDMSKLEAGSVELDCVDFSPARLLEGVVSLFEPRAEEKGFSVHIEKNLQLPEGLHGDATKIRQVLLNLVGNAVKFTETGGVYLSADFGVDNAGRSLFTVTVRDTGIGIAAEAQSSLFENFTQADSSISRRYGGTGLGLSISKGFVDVMGGELSFESRIGEGTSFTVRVPLGKAKRPMRQERRAKPVVGEASLKGVYGGVLVVEDHPINRQVVAGFLSRFGIVPEYAENGAEAVALAEKKLYDLILMDIQMPVMDGVAAAKAIRAGNSQNATTPIIALTANAMVGDRERYKASGMNGYIAKPIDESELANALQRYLVAEPASDAEGPAAQPQDAAPSPSNAAVSVSAPASRPSSAGAQGNDSNASLSRAEQSLDSLLDDLVQLTDNRP